LLSKFTRQFLVQWIHICAAAAARAGKSLDCASIGKGKARFSLGRPPGGLRKTGSTLLLANMASSMPPNDSKSPSSFLLQKWRTEHAAEALRGRDRLLELRATV